MKKVLIIILIFFLGLFLRFYQLSSYPPGLSLDEASIGVNAYSLLSKGTDEHGEVYPLWFKAFGEYKLPIYIYLTEVSMIFFGKSEFAIRFPSALFGSLSIIVLFYLINELTINHTEKRYSNLLPFLSAFMLAISPWHLQFTRTGFEASVGLFFYLTATLYSFIFIRTHKAFSIIIALVFFALTFYTYNAYRIITPLTILFLVLNYLSLYSIKKVIQHRKFFGGLSFLLLVLIAPSLLFMSSDAGAERLQQVSIIKTNADLLQISTFQILLTNYLSHFSFINLFIGENHLGQFHTDYFGLLLKATFPLLILGIAAFFILPASLLKRTLLFLLFAAPIPASLAEPTPHALRSLLLLVPVIIICGLGIIKLIEFKGKIKSIIIGGIILFTFFEFSFYLHSYYVHYPISGRIHWGSLYKELITEVRKYANDYDHIAFNTDDTYQSYIYLRFYAEDLNINSIDSRWEKTEDKVLYISKKEAALKGKLLEEVKASDSSHEVFFEIQEL